MATLWTNKYTIYNTTYGWMYGYASYSTSDSDTAVTVSCSALGEASTEGPGTYTERASASFSLTFGGNTVASGSFSSSRSRRCDEGVYKYYATGGSGSKSISKGTTATTATLKLTYTIRGTSYTGSVSINIPALTKHTVSYSANGGSGAPSAQTKYYGKNITLSSTIPTRTGYTFVGWGTSSSKTTADYAAGSTYSVNQTTNVTLYAIWKKTITLSYDANNGSGAPSSQSTTIYNATTDHEFTISSTRPTRTNYDFLGWSLSDTATTASYQPSGLITLSNSDTLYAVWKLAYVASTISNINAVRCNSDGTNNDDGDHGKLTFKVSKYSNGSSQSYPTISAVYDTNTSITLSYTEANNIRTYTSNYFSLSGDSQHDIVITKVDGSYGTKTFSTYISAKFFTIDITADGKGIGLLTTAPDKGIALGDYITTNVALYKSSGDSPSLIFQRGDLTDNYNDWRIYDKGGYLYFGQRGSGSTNWPTSQEWSINTSGKFSGYVDWDKVSGKPALADWVVDEGSVEKTGITWSYQKWNSGKTEFWGIRLWSSQAVTTTWGSVYYVNLGQVEFPFSLTSVNAVVNVGNRSTSARGWFLESTDRSVSKTGSLYFVTPTTYSNIASVVADIHVVGRWKT